MKHAVIDNIPNNPKEIMDYALSKLFDNWVDEKGTEKNPKIHQRKPSDLTYEEAFKIIQDNKPYWTISFRNNAYFKQEDYWEFGGCNIGDNDYGEVFIWICVNIKEAEKIFKKFNLIKKEY